VKHDLIGLGLFFLLVLANALYHLQGIGILCGIGIVVYLILRVRPQGVTRAAFWGWFLFMISMVVVGLAWRSPNPLLLNLVDWIAAAWVIVAVGAVLARMTHR
jgi:hypothetical protein